MVVSVCGCFQVFVGVCECLWVVSVCVRLFVNGECS